MGIEGLLQFIKPAVKQDHISIFQGKKAAIDGMSWLYRGCYSCAHELNQNIETKSYLLYLQKMVQLLQCYNIKPIIVLDGKQLSPKEKTEEIRKENKKKNKELGEKYTKENNPTEAKKYFQRAITITQEMIYLTIDVLRQQKIEVIVAPYEADAQIAYMVLNKKADFAITEDSDLICYNCPNLIYKLKVDGFCEILEYQKIKDSVELRRELNSNLKSFFTFTQEQVIDACILAGCDYLPSIKNIGIKRSVDYINRFLDAQTAVGHMRTEKGLMGKIPEDYEQIVAKIRNIFLYQRVYDSDKKQLITSNKLPKNFAYSQNLIGKEFQNPEKFCKGLLDIKTLKEREVKEIDFKKLFKNAIKKVNNDQNDLQQRALENAKKYEGNQTSYQNKGIQAPNNALNNDAYKPQNNIIKQKKTYPKLLLNNQTVEQHTQIQQVQDIGHGDQDQMYYIFVIIDQFLGKQMHNKLNQQIQLFTYKILKLNIQKDLMEAEYEQTNHFRQAPDKSKDSDEDDFMYLFKMCEELKEDDGWNENNEKGSVLKFHEPLHSVNSNSQQPTNEPFSSANKSPTCNSHHKSPIVFQTHKSPDVPHNPFAKKDHDKVRDSLFQADNSKFVKKSPLKYQNNFQHPAQINFKKTDTLDKFLKTENKLEHKDEKPDKKRGKKSTNAGQLNLTDFFVKK